MEQKSVDKLKAFSSALGFFVIVMGLVGIGTWVFGKGLFYSETHPVMSPFTYFSLVLMMTAKMAEVYIETWSKLFTLALLGIVSCGNFSSLWIQLTIPELFLNSLPGVVPTSIMTSLGLILFCFYDVLISIRRTPKSTFIFDDILLHLALFPGGLSFLGHVLGVKAYMSTSLDPRVGIAPIEMIFMGCYAIIAVIMNRDLFLWRFLSKSFLNKTVFFVLFMNQYIAPILIGLTLRPKELSENQFGIEYYAMFAGVLATLVFLIVNAFLSREDKALL